MEKIIDRFIAIIEDVAKGNYNVDIMEFTGPSHSSWVRRAAEAMAMMMVKVEVRELRLEGLVEELRVANDRLRENIVQTVTSIAMALSARDKESSGHAERVAVYAARLARRAGLSPRDVEFVRLGGLLHDVGKIGFSDKLFRNEDSNPSPELWEEIHRHPAIGAGIVQGLDFLGPAADYILSHHERLDGRGYPRGLKGEEIPLGARIIAVVDCYDAMTTDRNYQKGKTPEEAASILRGLRGVGLDRDLVDAFLAGLAEGEEPAPVQGKN
ncbi:MAG: HD domain-containing phosphohydrolase [Pseudomonadota bacterium]